MTVEKNIAYGLEIRKLDKKEIRKRVGEIVELMGLRGMEKRRPAQLSGGQRQRVALARSLILRPKVLLLDEPLASLDRKLRKEMQVELKRIQREVGITFLYVTHDQKVALSISDTIAIMREGRLEQVGVPNEIYETPKTKFVADFMGVTNIFAGKATATSGGKIQLETQDGLKITACEIKGLSIKKITGISVRPELIKVLPKDAGLKADNVFRGKIREMIYQGDFIEMEICLDRIGRVIYVRLGNDQKQHFSQGEEVVVQWNAEDSNILLD